MSFISDFKAFAMRGNVVDMAVGIIIGTAFGTIVSSLVADVVMPPIGMLIGGVDFTNFGITIKEATATHPAIVIAYGKFIQTIINFLIIAFSIFIMIKMLTKLEKKKAPAPATPPAPTKDQELLTEIRDLLKTK